jgi:HEAT repeat protein
VIFLAIGAGARRAAPALIGALTALEQEVRSAAARALGRLCPDDKDAREALRKALLDPDAEVRRLASVALLSKPK